MTEFDDQKPLGEVEYAILDFETTGTSPAYGHRVCEVGLRLIEVGSLDENAQIPKLRVTDELQQLVDPGRDISDGARQVSGITRKMVADKPEFEQVADQLLDRLAGRPVVAHYAPFDLKFLAAELEVIGREKPRLRALDSCRLARRHFNFSSNGLENIAAELGVEQPSHRALADVRALSEVWAWQLKELSNENADSLADLFELQGEVLELPENQGPTRLPYPVEAALADGKPLNIVYETGSGNRSRRRVTPLRATRSKGRDYLIAHCHRVDEQRTFRLDRIHETDYSQA